MLISKTKEIGPIAVKGLIADRIGMNCKIALARKTTFESLKNCRNRHLGKKVSALYLAVKT